MIGKRGDVATDSPAPTLNQPHPRMSLMRFIQYALLLPLLFAADVANACSCNLGSAQDKLKKFGTVFLGTVQSVEKLDQVTDFNERRIRVTFDVEKRWKGKADAHVLETVQNQSSCSGYWFKAGERFLIYASRGPWGGLDVMWCGGAVSEDEGKAFTTELQYLLQQPHQDERSDVSAD